MVLGKYVREKMGLNEKEENTGNEIQWDATNIDDFKHWLAPLQRWKKDAIMIETEDTHSMTVKLFTERYMYQIYARADSPDTDYVSRDNYLGCIVKSRHNSNDMRDMKDGGLYHHVWMEILADILAYELMDVPTMPRISDPVSVEEDWTRKLKPLGDMTINSKPQDYVVTA